MHRRSWMFPRNLTSPRKQTDSRSLRAHLVEQGVEDNEPSRRTRRRACKRTDHEPKCRPFSTPHNILAGAIRSAFHKITAALEAVLGVLRRLPDFLGFDGITGKIQMIIMKIRRAVEAVIDIILRTLAGAGNSAAQAASAIAGVLLGVAAAI